MDVFDAADTDVVVAAAAADTHHRCSSATTDIKKNFVFFHYDAMDFEESEEDESTSQSRSRGRESSLQAASPNTLYTDEAGPRADKAAAPLRSNALHLSSVKGKRMEFEERKRAPQDEECITGDDDAAADGSPLRNSTSPDGPVEECRLIAPSPQPQETTPRRSARLVMEEPMVEDSRDDAACNETLEHAAWLKQSGGKAAAQKEHRHYGFCEICNPARKVHSSPSFSPCINEAALLAAEDDPRPRWQRLFEEAQERSQRKEERRQLKELETIAEEDASMSVQVDRGRIVDRSLFERLYSEASKSAATSGGAQGYSALHEPCERHVRETCATYAPMLGPAGQRYAATAPVFDRLVVQQRTQSSSGGSPTVNEQQTTEHQQQQTKQQQPA